MKIRLDHIKKRRIPGHPGYCVHSSGRVENSSGKEMSQHLNSRGYPRVTLGGKAVLVHRLVSRAFLGPCPEGQEVCHKDGDKLNCRLSNLRYGTPKSNQADRWDHGTMSHIIHRDERRTIFERYQNGETQRELSEEYGVERSTICFNLRRHCEDTGEKMRQAYESIIPDEDLPELLRDYESGRSLRSISDDYETEDYNVHRYLRREALRQFEAGNRDSPKVVKKFRPGTGALTPDQEEEVRRLHSEGMSQRAIARKMGVSATPVRRAIQCCFT